MKTKLLKSLLAIACLLCSIGVYASSAVVTPYSCDFTNGGEGFTYYDQDGEVPSVTAQKYGFSADCASWIFGTIEKEYVAMSNSSHKKATATAEDWLITPAITLGEGNTLSFDAYTVAYSNIQRVATIDVKLSTTGIAIEDFTIDLLSDVQVTSGNYGVNLSAYAGQTVYIAIINKSRSKDMLVVDNLFVGVLPIATAKAQYTRLQENVSVGQRIAVELTAGFGDAVTSIDATLTCGDFSTRHAEEALTLEAGAAYVFQFDETLPAPTAGEGQFFEISVLVNGTETITTHGEIITQAYQPTKRVVCESNVGTWDGYSPRSYVYMKMMDEQYPDTYIGIASHSNDIMQNNDYKNYLSTYINTTPSGRVQRNNLTNECNPSDFPTLYNTNITAPAWADVALEAERIEETNSIRLTSSTTFALNARNFDTRLEYVIVEDDVNQPGNNNYVQSNYYAGGQYGQMGGYENKAYEIPAAMMFYDDVVRYIITDKVGNGIAGSVPTKIEKGVTYKHSTEITVPDNILNLHKCEFILLLLDSETGIILNAAKCRFSGVSDDPIYLPSFCVDGICYDAISNTEVKVISNEDTYSGDVIIPEIVEFMGKTFSVTSIGDYAFYGCSDLTSVSIPSSITSIGANAFENCWMNGVYITDLSKWCNINFADYTANPLRKTNYFYINNVKTDHLIIPDNVTSIGNYAFCFCESLKEVVIGNNITSINNGAFEGCVGLETVTIPNNVTIIGERSFSNTGLTSVTIGNSVTSIANYAFDGCTGLTEIRIEATTPPTIYSSTFYQVDKSIPVYVPAGCEEAYRSADYWSEFTNIQAIKEPDVIATSLTLDNEVLEMYPGDAVQLTATVLPDNTTNKVVTWTSSDNEVATVDENGNVTAVSIGSATISATTTDGSNLTATCEVTVVQKMVKLTMQNSYYNNVIFFLLPGTEQKIQIVNIDPMFVLNTVMFNDENVTEQLIDGVYTTPALEEDAVINISYDIPTAEDTPMQNSRIKAYGYRGDVVVVGCERGESIAIYDVDGVLLRTIFTTSDTMRIAMPTDAVYVVKVADAAVKVAL